MLLSCVEWMNRSATACIVAGIHCCWIFSWNCSGFPLAADNDIVVVVGYSFFFLLLLLRLLLET